MAQGVTGQVVDENNTPFEDVIIFTAEGEKGYEVNSVDTYVTDGVAKNIGSIVYSDRLRRSKNGPFSSD